MKYSELEDHVWRRLGPRKYIAGRGTVMDLVRLTVEQWEPEMFGHCADDTQRSAVVANVVASVKRMHSACGGYSEAEYGMIWLILLSALVNAIVYIVLRWWYDESSHRVLMAGWQREFTR